MASPFNEKKITEPKPYWKLLLGLVFFLFSALSLYLFLHSSFFAVKEIQTTGLSLLKPQEVTRLTGIRLGSNIFLLKETEVSERLLLHPAVESCQVTRKLPSTVEIIVKERTPLALLPAETGFMVIDSHCRYLNRVGSIVEVNLPVITGVDILPEVFPGDILGNTSLEQFLIVMQQFSPSLTQEISEINLSNENCLCIYTLGKVEIKVGRLEHLSENLPTLELIVGQELKRLNQQPIEYVDMSFNGPPVIKFKQSN